MTSSSSPHTFDEGTMGDIGSPTDPFRREMRSARGGGAVGDSSSRRSLPSFDEPDDDDDDDLVLRTKRSGGENLDADLRSSSTQRWSLESRTTGSSQLTEADDGLRLGMEFRQEIEEMPQPPRRTRRKIIMVSTDDDEDDDSSSSEEDGRRNAKAKSTARKKNDDDVEDEDDLISLSESDTTASEDDEEDDGEELKTRKTKRRKERIFRLTNVSPEEELAHQRRVAALKALQKQSREVDNPDERLNLLQRQIDVYTLLKPGVSSSSSSSSRNNRNNKNNGNSPNKRHLHDDAEINVDDGERRKPGRKRGVDDDLLDPNTSTPVVRLTTQPACIKTGELRDYQLEGLNWLINLYDSNLNGILADEMGLGKTFQTIAFLGYLTISRGVSGPHLVLVPKAVFTNWGREFARWCPDLRVVSILGDRRERREQIREGLIPGTFDVCVTTYDVLMRQRNSFLRFEWRCLVMDEAHRLKSEDTQIAQLVRKFRSRFRLLLTGTPLQNNLHELWSLLNLLLPELFADAGLFEDSFKLENITEERVVSKLHAILRPFMIRRLKADVEMTLPPKREVKLFTPLTEMQRFWYKAVLKRDLGDLGITASRTRLLNTLMHLRKVCNHPYLFPWAEAGPPYLEGEHIVENSGKLALLDKLLVKLKRNGDRVLIFSQMVRMLDLLDDYLVYRQYPFLRLDGNTSQGDRDAAMDAFNKEGSEYFAFLISTRAGGLGINLATANIVVLFDSDWNPHVDLQAQDRAHRIGQKREVTVFRLVTENTVEEMIMERAERKLFLDAAIVQQGRMRLQNAGLSQNELMAMIKFGAEAVFRSGGASEVTEEDIDAVLQRGIERTERLKEKLTTNAQFNLLNFQLKAEKPFSLKEEQEKEENSEARDALKELKEIIRSAEEAEEIARIEAEFSDLGNGKTSSEARRLYPLRATRVRMQRKLKSSVRQEDDDDDDDDKDVVDVEAKKSEEDVEGYSNKERTSEASRRPIKKVKASKEAQMRPQSSKSLPWWCGPPALRARGVSWYDGITLRRGTPGETIVKAGDFVGCHNSDGLPFIGMVVELKQNDATGIAGARLGWLLRRTDLVLFGVPEESLEMTGGGTTPHSEELFWMDPLHEDDNELDVVLRPVLVEFRTREWCEAREAEKSPHHARNDCGAGSTMAIDDEEVRSSKMERETNMDDCTIEEGGGPENLLVDWSVNDAGCAATGSTTTTTTTGETEKETTPPPEFFCRRIFRLEDLSLAELTQEVLDRAFARVYRSENVPALRAGSSSSGNPKKNNGEAGSTTVPSEAMRDESAPPSHSVQAQQEQHLSTSSSSSSVPRPSSSLDSTTSTRSLKLASYVLGPDVDRVPVTSLQRIAMMSEERIYRHVETAPLYRVLVRLTSFSPASPLDFSQPVDYGEHVVYDWSVILYAVDALNPTPAVPLKFLVTRSHATTFFSASPGDPRTNRETRAVAEAAAEAFADLELAFHLFVVGPLLHREDRVFVVFNTALLKPEQRSVIVL